MHIALLDAASRGSIATDAVITCAGRNKTHADADRCTQLIQERQSALVVSQMTNEVTTSQLRDLNHHARAHSEAFRKILVATGLTQEADVIQRWHQREQYVNEVELQVQSLHERLEQLTRDNKALTAELRSGKFQPELETAKNRAELVRACASYWCIHWWSHVGIFSFSL